MALSDVIKKKQATGDASEKDKAAKKNPLDDVRVVIAVLFVACIGLVVLTVFGAKGIDETKANIEKAKTQYKQNQLAIANLKALQARSGEYKQQIAEYDIMISKDPLDQMQIMIDLEKDVEAHNCSLTELTFGEPEKNEQNVNQIAVNLTITGSYRDIITFCHDTVSDKQIKRIDTINITGTDEQRTAQIVLVEFSR